jgi:hypothetical protein
MNNHRVKKISNEDRLGVVVEQSELFLGPLPPPEVLKGDIGVLMRNIPNVYLSWRKHTPELRLKVKIPNRLRCFWG